MLRNTNPNSWIPDALSMKYLWLDPNDNVSIPNDEIARTKGLSRESVRKRSQEHTVLAIKMLKEDFQYEGMMASSEMKLLFKEFENSLKSIGLYSIMNRQYGRNDAEDRTLRFYLDGLGYTISKQEPHFCYKLSIDDGINERFISKGISTLKKYFKTAASPLCLETEVSHYMANNLRWGKARCDLMTDYLKADTDCFEKLPSKAGMSMYSLRWELNTEAGRIAQILYTFNANNGWNQKMSRAEVIQEYNNRASQFPNITVLSPSRSIQNHPHIEHLKAGFYRYCVDSSAIPQIDIVAELESFVLKKGGRISLDDAIAFVHTINDSFSPNTVIYYLQKADCRGDGTGYYVHKSIPGRRVRAPRSLAADKTLKVVSEILEKEGRALEIQKELIPLFLKEYGLSSVNPVSLRNILKRVENVLFIFPSKSVELILKKEELDAFDFSAFAPQTGKTASGDHFREIRAYAIDILSKEATHSLSKKDLFDSVLTKYPHKASQNNIYKEFAKMVKESILEEIGKGKGGYLKLNQGIIKPLIASDIDWPSLKTSLLSLVKNPYLNEKAFDEMLGIMRIDPSKPVDDKNELWRMMMLLGEYFTNSINENETEFLVWKLYLGIESYLKLYATYPIKEFGLGTVIDNLQQNGELPDRYGSYPVGSVAFEFNRITGLMINNRGSISHVMNQGHNTDNYFASNIQQTLKYYLLIAAYKILLNQGV